MAKVKNVEKKIWDVEGFDVCFIKDGRDVRGDKQDMPQYNSFVRAARHDSTVAEWKKNRFAKLYPGYQVEVLDGNGEAVHGATKLGTVRDTYIDDGDAT